MKLGRNLLALAAVAAVAFLVGQSGWLAADEAAAQYGEKDHQDKAAQKVAEQMEAWTAAGTPSAHHEELEVLVGDWDAVYKIWMAPDAPPMTSTGTVSRKWMLGKRFIREHVAASSEWGSFNGMGIVGYNNFDGVYEVAWMDDMGTGISKQIGTFNPKKKTMSFAGRYRDPANGRIITTRDLLDLSNPDRHTFTSWMVAEDGTEFKHMEGVTERK